MKPKNALKIAFISTYPPEKCGIADYTYNLESNLKKICDISTLKISGKRVRLTDLIRTARKTKSFDIIHVQHICDFFGVGFFNRLAGFYTPIFYYLCSGIYKRKIVTTLHEIFDAETTFRGRKIKPFVKAYYRWVYRSIDKYSEKIILHTEQSKKTLSQYLKITDKYIVLPHPIYIKPIHLEQEKCKKALNLPEGEIITAFGYVNEKKGLSCAINWMMEFHRQDNLHLVIAGEARSADGEIYLQKLKDFVRDNNLREKVMFTGYTKEKNIPVLMNASDIFIFLYEESTQSGSLSYALAYKKPIIASAIGGFKEIRDEYNCILCFQKADIKDLENKYKSLNANKRLELAANTDKCLKDRDVGVITQKYLNIYKEL